MIHVDPAHIAPTPAPADAPTADARARIEGQLAMLDRLSQIGMEIAEACGREAKAAPNAGEARAVGLIFARVARAVRMTIALQSRLAKDLAALDRADGLAQAAQRSRRRVRLSRLVEDAARASVAARREAGHQYWADEDAIEDEIEQLSSEAYERLVDAEEDDLSGLSFGEAAAAICNDLGLSPDWTARLLAAADPTSPTRSVAGGGPAPEEGTVEGESQGRCGPGPGLGPAPSTTRSSASGPPPAIAAAMGEVAPREPP
jgi:hypothetical protein